MADLEYFLVSQGFDEVQGMLPGWYMGKLKDLHLNDPGSGEAAVKIVGFENVPDNVLKEVAARVFDRVAPIPEGGLTSEKIDQSISSCVVKDGEVTAYLAIEKIDDGLVRIPALYSSHTYPKDMMSMIARTVRELKEAYPEDTRIAMLVMNKMTDKLIHQLFKELVNCTKRFVRV
jgi:hypothetical protein